MKLANALERTRGVYSVLLTLVGLALASALVLSACATQEQAGAANSSGEPTALGQSSSATQTNEAGSVTISVTWRGPSAGLAFLVEMNTHSVDLDGYDLTKIAVLRTDQGVEVRPDGWDAPEGGHHRSGTLTFQAKDEDGNPAIGPDTRTVELVIRDVAGVPERVFQWKP